MSWKAGERSSARRYDLDRLAQLARLAIRVAERGVQVRELARGGRIERTALDCERAEPARERSRPLPLATLLEHAGEGERTLRVARVDRERALEARHRLVERTAALVHQADEVVEIRVAGMRGQHLRERRQRHLVLAPLEAAPGRANRIALEGAHAGGAV